MHTAALQRAHHILTAPNFTIFDLLTRTSVALIARNRERVERGARALLDTLKREKLVLDWKKRQSAHATIQVTICGVLNQELPVAAYTRNLYEQKCDPLFQHIYDTCADATHSIYSA